VAGGPLKETRPSLVVRSRDYDHSIDRSTVLRTKADDVLLQIGAAVGVPASIVECVGVDKMHFPGVTRCIGCVHD
jgi:hypothetical protein